MSATLTPETATDTRAPELSRDEILRYSRHLILPNVGVAGHRKLKAAKVLHGTKDVGRKKLDSVRDRIHDVNPSVELTTYETALTSENALDIIRDYDIVVAGTDNFPTRYFVNDACVLLGRPDIYGSIFRFEGQASVFSTEDGPCYRCLFPEPPPRLVPSCAEGGMLGVLPGLVDTIQATEAIKLILGIGEPLIGRLLLVDTRGASFRTVQLRKDPTCPACGTRAIKALIDYQEFCGVPQAAAAAIQAGEVAELTPRELADRLKAGDALDLIDVREPHEWELTRIEGARLVPLGTVPNLLDTFDRSRDIVVQCKGGVRSAKAVRQLLDAGYTHVWNLTGGILRWSDDVDPTIPKS
jgi:molybdopterin/thiamine biosynthesis adenylyltransferase/rhodanese-related sulfurtransferase